VVIPLDGKQRLDMIRPHRRRGTLSRPRRGRCSQNKRAFGDERWRPAIGGWRDDSRRGLWMNRAFSADLCACTVPGALPQAYLKAAPLALNRYFAQHAPHQGFGVRILRFRAWWSNPPIGFSSLHIVRRFQTESWKSDVQFVWR
jgi:hypothetical protein